MEPKKTTHGGAREGAGRPASGDPTKKFSMAAKTSEYELISQAAQKAGKTIIAVNLPQK